MSSHSPLNRRVLNRILVYYRADPATVRPLLPTGLEPSTQRGHALVGLCYTRLAGVESRWLPRQFASVCDQVSYHFPVDAPTDAGSRRALWIGRRDTSSWLRARCTGRLRGDSYHLSHFEVEQGGLSIRLRVDSEAHEELYLRGEVRPTISSCVFRSTIEAEEFLGSRCVIHSTGEVTPDQDELGLSTGEWALEPMAVFDIRCSYFEDTHVFPRGSIEFDTGFSVVRSRIASAPRPALAAQREDLVLPPPTAPYLPAQ